MSHRVFIEVDVKSDRMYLLSADVPDYLIDSVKPITLSIILGRNARNTPQALFTALREIGKGVEKWMQESDLSLEKVQGVPLSALWEKHLEDKKKELEDLSTKEPQLEGSSPDNAGTLDSLDQKST